MNSLTQYKNRCRTLRQRLIIFLRQRPAGPYPQKRISRYARNRPTRRGGDPAGDIKGKASSTRTGREKTSNADMSRCDMTSDPAIFQWRGILPPSRYVNFIVGVHAHMRPPGTTEDVCSLVNPFSLRRPHSCPVKNGGRNGRGKIPISSPGPLFETAQGEVPLRIPTRLCQSINHALHSRLPANAVSPSKAPGGVPPCSVSNDRPDKAGGSASRWPDPASGQSP